MNSLIALATSRTMRETIRFMGVIALCALVLSIIPIGCPIKFFTGLSCPGCGLSRAWFAFIGFHPLEALAYHPLFWMVPFAVAICVTPANGRSGVVKNLLLITIIALFLITWVVRFFFGGDIALLGTDMPFIDVVNWAPPSWWALLTNLL